MLNAWHAQAKKCNVNMKIRRSFQFSGPRSNILGYNRGEFGSIVFDKDRHAVMPITATIWS